MLLAVLFLEFWKRRQFVLEHDWDVLGYEEAEVRTGRNIGIESIVENIIQCTVTLYITDHSIAS